MKQVKNEWSYYAKKLQKNGGGNPAEGLSRAAIPLQFRSIMQNWQYWSNMILYDQSLPAWNK